VKKPPFSLKQDFLLKSSVSGIIPLCRFAAIPLKGD
jgi:hypothetical protein